MSFPHHLSAKCDFPRDCPKFILRQGHARKGKAVRGGAKGLDVMHVIRYGASPGVTRQEVGGK